MENNKVSFRGGKLKKKVISVLIVLLFLFFIGIMDYPYVTRLINEGDQTQMVNEYYDVVKKMNKAQIDEEIKKAEEYNKSLQNGISKQAFSDSFDVKDTGNNQYNNLLDVTKNGVMATIEIPKIKVNLPIYHTTNEYSLENGVGHLEGSSLPVGGENTHTCLSAHRGLPSETLFTDLDQITVGDKFFITVYEKKLAYEVYDIETVSPEETSGLKIQENKDLATLITCTPYGVNSHRIYVHGQNVPYEDGDNSDKTYDLLELLKNWWWVLATILLLVWLVFLLRHFNKKPIKQKTNSRSK